jgi:hypothetical protein
VLNGSVNPKGTATNAAFQYGLSTSYETQTPLLAVGKGTSTVKVSQPISGLQANAVYHYRLVAFGAATVPGADHTFKTGKVPLSLTITTSPNPVPFATPLTVSGTLSGSENAGRQLLLKANPFPYLGIFTKLGPPAVTSATGSYSFFVPALLENTQLLVSMVAAQRVISPVVAENVAVRVALHVRRTRRRGFVRLYGSVTPAEVGAQVGFELVRPGRTSLIVSGTRVKAATPTVSRFSRIVRIRHRGLYRALVRISDGAHVSDHSAPVLIR